MNSGELNPKPLTRMTAPLVERLVSRSPAPLESAGADPTRPGSPHSILGDARPAPAQGIASALERCQLRRDLLTRVRKAVEQLQTLTRKGQEEGLPQRDSCEEACAELAEQVDSWLRAEWNGHKLFCGRVEAVAVGEGTNQLIMAGLDPLRGPLGGLRSLSVSDPIQAVEALLHVEKALGAVAVFQAILAENHGRLTFLQGEADLSRNRLPLPPSSRSRE